MNTKINFIQTEKGIVSVQNDFPTVDGKEQPMEMLIVIEQEGKDIVYNFKKEQAKALFKEMKRAVSLIDFMG
ncbi:MAG: hypothetical protein PHS59_15865 [Paludibacter sp.]|nr:hypothetical protein [Paludibacter sp.]